MSWQLKNLHYSWKIGIAAVLTGATIYTANNVLMRITQRDAVQVVLGTHERCLATQTGTNADGSGIYSVAPPSFVRSWYSNSYETQVVAGVTSVVAVLHTNVFTNVISERLDRAILVGLDAKMTNLPPYYTTNPPGRYTNNLPRMSVTEIFASLQIGDHTNQFTSIPCWTNNVGQTNATTNAATFGPWAWRNYIMAWQERYKFINALENHVRSVIVNGSEYTQGRRWSVTVDWGHRSTTYFRENYYDPPNPAEGFTNLLAHILTPPAALTLRGIANDYWGTNMGKTLIGSNGTTHSVILPNPFYTTDVDYVERTYVTASTNNTVGAIKTYSYSKTDPFLNYWEETIADNEGYMYRAEAAASITLTAGTYYFNRVYSNDAAVAEWMHGELNSNKFVVVVTISGSGGGLIPGYVLADSVSVGSWNDLSTNQSPYLAASNIVDSLLEISAGNLDLPTESGSKSESPSPDSVIPYTIWFSEGTDVKFHPYFQDVRTNWYDKFSYCTEKYW